MEMNYFFVLFMIIVSVIHSVPIKVNDALSYLKLNGYIQCDDELCSEIALPEALRDFQNRSGLPVTGMLDDRTKALMSQQPCDIKEESLVFSHAKKLCEKESNRMAEQQDTILASSNQQEALSNKPLSWLNKNSVIQLTDAYNPEESLYEEMQASKGFDVSQNETSQTLTDYFGQVSNETTQTPDALEESQNETAHILPTDFEQSLDNTTETLYDVEEAQNQTTQESSALLHSVLIDVEEALQYLEFYGYIECDDKSCSNIVLSEALRNFQNKSGLAVTGLLDDRTKAMMSTPRCGVKEIPVNAADGTHPLLLGIQWRKRNITWSFLGPRPSQISTNRTIAILKDAFQSWANIVPLTFTEVCKKCRPDIPIHFRAIPRKNNLITLGYKGHQSPSAYFDDGSVYIVFNKDVPWTEMFPKKKTGAVNFFLIAVHEIGHALGLDHDESTDAIMFANYGYKYFQRKDIVPHLDTTEMQKLYGGRKSSPKPTQPSSKPSTSWPRTTTPLPTQPSSKPSTSLPRRTTPLPPQHGEKIHWNKNHWAHACDFHGRNLDNVKTAPERCGPKCAQTKGCTHFTWTQYNGGTCWMRMGDVSKNDAFSTYDQTMVCGVILPSSTIRWNGNNWAYACDFHEKHLDNVKSAPELCGPKCLQTKDCTHFTWTQYNGGTCWMRMGDVSKSDAFSTYDQTMICGVVDPSPNRDTDSIIHWNGNNWAPACDFHERSLDNVQIAADLCGPKCAQTKDCTHYTWTRHNGGTCWMKTGNVSKSDAFSTHNQTMVCGVVASA